MVISCDPWFKWINPMKFFKECPILGLNMHKNFDSCTNLITHVSEAFCGDFSPKTSPELIERYENIK